MGDRGYTNAGYEEDFALNQPDDRFHDEPNTKKRYNPQGDPMKWNPTPRTIVILVILNIIVAAAVGYLIWFVVDRERDDSPSRTSTTPPPTAAPTVSAQPSAAPSTTPSDVPSNAPSQQPSLLPSSLPSIEPSQIPSLPPSIAPSNNPTAVASESPTREEFICFLCGEGKNITNTTAEIPFGGRLTKTCGELQEDADNGDISEESCEILFDLVDEPCQCRPTTPIANRTDASVRALFGTVVGTQIDFDGSNEDRAADFIFDNDSYYDSVVTFATDDELIQRYLMTLFYIQTENNQADLTALLNANSAVSECSWVGVTCSFGQIVAVNGTGLGLTGELEGDIFALPSVESIDLSNNQFTGDIPPEVGEATLLTALDLSSNQLSGSIPTELFSLTKLTSLDLSDNNLAGAVGSGITKLTRLKSLILTDNAFTGSLPTCDASIKPTTVQADCAEIACSCCNNCST